MFSDVRTYAAIPLNDECGLIQWVPNTVCMRPILVKAYSAKNLKSWVRRVQDTTKYSTHELVTQDGHLHEDCAKIKGAKLKDVGKVFQDTILAR